MSCWNDTDQEMDNMKTISRRLDAKEVDGLDGKNLKG